jgi:hypothetical protein
MTEHPANLILFFQSEVKNFISNSLIKKYVCGEDYSALIKMADIEADDTTYFLNIIKRRCFNLKDFYTIRYWMGYTFNLDKFKDSKYTQDIDGLTSFLEETGVIYIILFRIIVDLRRIARETDAHPFM